MKNFKSLVLLVAIAASTVLSASTNPTKADRPVNEITAQIGNLLENPNFKVQETITADVTFTVNDKHEIVVLSVDTDAELVESYIKSRLNYKALNAKTNSKPYTVPVRIVPN